jgi:hypothetical protein
VIIRWADRAARSHRSPGNGRWIDLTDEQDLTARRQELHALGVPPDRVYIDHGISGTKRERPGLDRALAAVRTGDTLVVPELDRLARSVPDARDIGDTLAKRGVSLSLGVRSTHGRVKIEREWPVLAVGQPQSYLATRRATTRLVE